MRPPQKFLKAGLALGALALLCAGALFLYARHQVEKTLEKERKRVEPVSFPADVREVGAMNLARLEGWKIFATGREIRGIALFENQIWAATSGGLLSLSLDGRNSILYTRLNGLPDADVTCLAESEGKLFAGTGSGALLIVKNGLLSIITLRGMSLGPITALISAPGGVIIGTGESGVWRFDGRGVSDIGKGRAGADFKRITALHRYRERLVVGTFDDGVFVEGLEGFSHYAEAQGLPMNQVTSLGGESELLHTLFLLAVGGDGRQRVTRGSIDL